MTDIILIALLAAILGGAAWYVYRAKKKGVKCIGCPEAKSCAARGGCDSCPGCACREK